MDNVALIKAELRKNITLDSQKATRFFKTKPSEYGAHDEFIGVTVPNIRRIAKDFENLNLSEIQSLISSPINEERLCALIVLCAQYNKPKIYDQKLIYHFYVQNLQYVNNWNLVDSSAHIILGAYLYNKDKSELVELAKSDFLWDRRIAIVATWYFIRRNDLEWTFRIAKELLYDKHDLIHKAVGWMLREAGKRNSEALVEFLDIYSEKMPRTMLRYAIEKL